MAGHSKHNNIKHRKSAQDAKRSAQFSKLAKEITTAAREGGPSIHDNAALRTAVERALAANMKRATIDAAIAKATSAGDELGQGRERCIYEGYGPGGVALLIACSTDNRNRTAAEVRHALSRYGASLASAGSVRYLFERQHHAQLELRDQADAEAILDLAIDAGARDVAMQADGSALVVGSREVVLHLRTHGIVPTSVRCVDMPTRTVALSVAHSARLEALQAALLELDDVQSVTSNRAPDADR